MLSISTVLSVYLHPTMYIKPRSKCFYDRPSSNIQPLISLIFNGKAPLPTQRTECLLTSFARVTGSFSGQGSSLHETTVQNLNFCGLCTGITLCNGKPQQDATRLMEDRKKRYGLFQNFNVG